MTKAILFIKNISKKIKPYLYMPNLFLFMFKIILFLLTKSLFFIISALYNLCIGFAKLKVYSKNENYWSVGLFIIFSSICFILYSIWTIIAKRIVNYDLYTGIFIATVTFFDIGYSIYGIIKESKNNHVQNKLLKLINLATALVSLELTQSALLSFTMINADNSLYNGLIGIIVGICSLLIGIFIIIKSIKKCAK